MAEARNLPWEVVDQLLDELNTVDKLQEALTDMAGFMVKVVDASLIFLVKKLKVVLQPVAEAKISRHRAAGLPPLPAATCHPTWPPARRPALDGGTRSRRLRAVGVAPSRRYVRRLAESPGPLSSDPIPAPSAIRWLVARWVAH